MVLVDEARHWWRLWSIRINALLGFFASAAMQHNELLTGPLVYVPAYWRPLASVLVGLTIFALPSAARLLKQRLPDGQQ